MDNFVIFPIIMFKNYTIQKNIKQNFVQSISKIFIHDNMVIFAVLLMINHKLRLN